jgi:DNA-binding SARP family transcriptional activator
VEHASLAPRSLGGLVRDSRGRGGWTQQETADRSGLSVGGLRDLEQQCVVPPRGPTLRRLARALELSATETAELVRLAGSGPVLSRDFCVRILGPMAIEAGGGTLALGSGRQRTMLALLALSPGVPVSRESLIDAMWGAHPPATAADLVHSYVSRMRRRFSEAGAAGDPALSITDGGYELSIAEDQLDLQAFRTQSETGRREARDGRLDAALTGYENAVGLWRGDPLSDLPNLQVHPSVVAIARERWITLHEYTDVATRYGRGEEILPLLHMLADAEPFNETLHARLMRALADAGQQAAALDVFTMMRRRLADELGVDPEPQLQEIYNVILRTENRITVAARHPAGAGLLPAGVRGFVGRTAELAFLDRVLDDAEHDDAVATIATIVGMVGVGKTALAVRWAHGVGARFTDGRLYADLGGSAPDAAASRPEQVLATFLAVLGVPREAVPADLAGRTRLYQELLAGKRILVVLDNARSVDQIRPLIPGSPGCMTVVTSNRQLTDLVVEYGARVLPVDVMSPSDAHAMLSTRIGRTRVAAEPEGVDRIVERCARLPIALASVAAQAVSRPAFPLAVFADRLDSPYECLEALDSGEPATSPRSRFTASYRELTPAGARLFRLLGTRADGEVTLAQAAGLAGSPVERVRPLLAELARLHLAIEHAPGRYRVHRLLRAFAIGLSADADAA